MSWRRWALVVALIFTAAVAGFMPAVASPASAATAASPASDTINPCDPAFGECTTQANLYATGDCLLTATVDWGDDTSTTVTLMDQSTTLSHTYDEAGKYTVSDTGTATPTSSGAVCDFIPFSYDVNFEQPVIGTNVLPLPGDADATDTWSETSGPSGSTTQFASGSSGTTATVSEPGT